MNSPCKICLVKPTCSEVCENLLSYVKCKVEEFSFIDSSRTMIRRLAWRMIERQTSNSSIIHTHMSLYSEGMLNVYKVEVEDENIVGMTIL